MVLLLLSCSVVSDFFKTPWAVAHQAPLSMGFSRQEYWSGLPFPSAGIFLTQGSNSGLLHYRRVLYHLSHTVLISETVMCACSAASVMSNSVRPYEL